MAQGDEYYMELALAEAARGLGRTSPNPAVGALLVREGSILGRGYHHRAGEPHAEVNALADARRNGHDTAGATLYVTLEPCNHRGRTPPCTEAILAAGIVRVVLGACDPNARVQGGGAALLAERGLSVRQGVLQAACRRLILPFAKTQRSGLPWVVMKAGLSLDGRISRRSGQGGAMTGPEAGHFVHGLRNQLDAILVGRGTALIDDPALSCRLAAEERRDPVRVVLDRTLRLPPGAKMLVQQSAAKTMLFCGERADAGREAGLVAAGAQVIRVAEQASGLDLHAVLRHLAQAGLCSVLVEGGARVHAAFLSAGLVDEVALLFAPCFVGETGTPLTRGPNAGPDAGGLFTQPLLETESRRLGTDWLLRGYFTAPDSLFAG